MAGYAGDGAHLTQGGPRPGGTRCEVCGEPLGDESWWVTRWPHGVHTRCRDWRPLPFPFARQARELRRLQRRCHGEAQRCCAATLAWLQRAERAWPTQAALGVERDMAILGRLRTKLSELEVDPRWVTRL